jgi:hypothetical protein
VTSSSALSTQIRRLKEIGHQFEKVNGTYTLIASSGAEVELAPAAHKEQRPERSRSSNGLAPLPPHPDFGSTLKVTMLAVTDEGRLQVGLRNADGGSWLCSVDGYLSS